MYKFINGEIVIINNDIVKLRKIDSIRQRIHARIRKNKGTYTLKPEEGISWLPGTLGEKEIYINTQSEIYSTLYEDKNVINNSVIVIENELDKNRKKTFEIACDFSADNEKERFNAVTE
ncbi:Uncharacterised protein [Sebaldella termitidis]|uniref:Uncharacterized protein n=1 Tax=Sebaldella termitidis (strain ATCC 33386 / NCTC 11300) TaxID=526218 RepID=D1AN61_SEBTE|nr:hypothetical protein [Sebaldella termitidis]ACZ09665.1 hypothetical protein Sterm_2821 [Sebaldella termitidis ATCC 33386]SUI24997.1 Uncharacterised protein [Sebaldella termitidis]